MNKQFFKFLPLMAAMIMATSCSKDDENNAPVNGRDDVHIVSTQIFKLNFLFPKSPPNISLKTILPQVAQLL